MARVDSGEMGFGMVLRDRCGSHIYSRTLDMSGLYTPEEGEAIGLFEALSWIKDLDVRNGSLRWMHRWW
ncbi:hypothetical protein ACS0TY_015781 [Phlomoides rotata]